MSVRTHCEACCQLRKETPCDLDRGLLPVNEWVAPIEQFCRHLDLHRSDWGCSSPSFARGCRAIGDRLAELDELPVITICGMGQPLQRLGRQQLECRTVPEDRKEHRLAAPVYHTNYARGPT